MKSKTIIGILLISILLYVSYRLISSSIYLQNQDRMNVFFYGKIPVFYSLSSNDVNYMVFLSATNEVLVPGGYGYYKLGGLGKLVYLEKKPELFRKTISANLSVATDLYFYFNKPIIYYDDQSSSVPRLPTFQDVFFTSSNASLLDRIILYLGFVRKKRSLYTLIRDLPKKLDRNRIVLNREEAFKLLQGYFYKQSHRKEKNTVQIVYTKSYSTALLLSQILEGEGIRVIDISEKKQTASYCTVTQNASRFSQTAIHMGSFFGCTVQKGKAEISDILFNIGNLEQDWAVQ